MKQRGAGGSKRQAQTPRTRTGGLPASTAEGVVSAHRSGFGFVRIEGWEQNVFLPPKQMEGVISGDRVRIGVREERDGRLSGQLQAVLGHGVESFLGTVEVSGRSVYVHSVDRRLSLRCLVSANHVDGARAGDWVIARITRYPTPNRLASAQIIRRLDPDRPLEMACESAIARSALPVEFDGEALREAEAYGERIDPRESAGRVDLRELPLVTIDGEDARDFDDAVCAEAHPKGFRLWVAIADVSHYVRIGSVLDREARERGTSVYFPNRVLPMLPTMLSNHLCSLEPEVDRLCLVAEMLIGKSGELLSWKFYPAVMRSQRRLTYDQAYAALFDGKPAERRALGSLYGKLTPLVDLYRVLAKARRRRGALEFESSEAVFDFSTAGHVQAIKQYARNDAHKLIEECMILANVAAARELRRARVGGLYRVHGTPEQKKLDLLRQALAAFGVEVDLPETVKPRDMQRITQRLGKSIDLAFVESLVVRSMQQAVYQPENIGHFGLALGEYAHFTSPIRRYPDLVVHRALKYSLDPQDPSAHRSSTAELQGLGSSLTQLEKRADEADRYVDNFLKCSYLRERLGQTFEGLVTTVVEYGCFVQLLGIGIDGLLRLEGAAAAGFEMERSGHAWRHPRLGLRLAIGDRIRVIVTNANPVEGQVDLEWDPA